MDAVKYLIWANKICQNTTECADCILRNERCPHNANVARHAVESVAIVEQYVKEHEKTLKQVFFERNPKAKHATDDTPMVCPHQVGLENEPYDMCSGACSMCVACWGRVYNEEDEDND